MKAAHRVIDGLIERVMFPELLAQQSPSAHFGVVARLECDRPRSSFMVSNVELVSVNSAGPLDDHAAATPVQDRCDDFIR